MDSLKRSTVALATAAALGAFPTMARADLIAPGTAIAGPSITTFFGGTLLASNSGGVATPTFTGTAITAVFRGGASVLCPAGGCLDFYYQIQTNAGGTDGPRRESFFDFDGFLTDVYQISNGSAIGGPWVNGTIASATADRNTTGVTIGSNYANSIFVPGTASLTFVVRTNATLFTSGVFGVIDGGVSQINSFSPTAVPEPSTVVLLGTGLVGLVAFARRRKKSA